MSILPGDQLPWEKGLTYASALAAAIEKSTTSTAALAANSARPRIVRIPAIEKVIGSIRAALNPPLGIRSVELSP
jgi:hypothetical protein